MWARVFLCLNQMKWKCHPLSRAVASFMNSFNKLLFTESLLFFKHSIKLWRMASQFPNLMGHSTLVHRQQISQRVNNKKVNVGQKMNKVLREKNGKVLFRGRDKSRAPWETRPANKTSGRVILHLLESEFPRSPSMSPQASSKGQRALLYIWYTVERH